MRADVGWNGEGVEADGGVRMKLTGEEARRSVN